MEKRRSNLTSTVPSSTLNTNRVKKNPFLFTQSTENETTEEESDNFLDQTQQKLTISSDRNKYYQDRASSVQGIEKTMNNMYSLMTKMMQVVYEQRYLIEK